MCVGLLANHCIGMIYYVSRRVRELEGRLDGDISIAFKPRREVKCED